MTSPPNPFDNPAALKRFAQVAALPKPGELQYINGNGPNDPKVPCVYFTTDDPEATTATLQQLGIACQTVPFSTGDSVQATGDKVPKLMKAIQALPERARDILLATRMISTPDGNVALASPTSCRDGKAAGDAMAAALGVLEIPHNPIALENLAPRSSDPAAAIREIVRRESTRAFVTVTKEAIMDAAGDRFRPHFSPDQVSRAPKYGESWQLDVLNKMKKCLLPESQSAITAPRSHPSPARAIPQASQAAL